MPFSFNSYILVLVYLTCFPVLAQTTPAVNHREALEILVKKEGEVFVSAEVFQEHHNKDCTIENVFANGLAITKQDSVKINYLNHTESFCEAFVLQSKMIYSLSLKDLEPAKLLLTQRNYNLGKGKLLDGQSTWYEILLHTRHNKPLITMRDLDNRKTERVSQMRLLFKTKAGAQKGMSHLKALAGSTE